MVCWSWLPSYLYLSTLVILFALRFVDVVVPFYHMHIVGSGLLSRLHDVYQCIFIVLKRIKEIQTHSIMIVRL